MAVNDNDSARKGLTIRSLAATVFALLLMGIWIEYVEVYNVGGGPLAQNSPPNSAVGVILAVMGIGSVLYMLRRSLRLATAELVVIYSALLLAAPLMTQGMWQRVFGLVATIPHRADFKTYESLPPMLWPHGPNLCPNGQFRDGLNGFEYTGGSSVTWTNLSRGSKGIWRSPVLSNNNEVDSNAVSRLSVTLDRYDAGGREILVPGENYLLSLLVKTEGFGKTSAYHVRLRAPPEYESILLASSQMTTPSLVSPEGFQRIGVNPVILPRTLGRKLTIEIGFTGAGRLIVQDVQFFNVQALEGVFTGRKFVRESNLAALDADERDFTSVRPDNMFSLSGLKYLFSGHIPLTQWVQPALAWGLLVGALFMGFLGLNILMRKQWVDNERFTFPLTILPKSLFAMENGRLVIFRHWVMWLGFGCTLPFVLAKGINFYIPGFPALGAFAQLDFKDYVTNPTLKAYLENVGICSSGLGFGFSFCILAIALLIETDVLFSLWSVFLIFQLWNLFGKTFNCTRFAGYPWEHQQTMGAFIAYALLAVFVGRIHLWMALKTALGRRTNLDQSHEVTSYRAAFLMIVAALCTFVAWGVWTRMGALASLFFFGYMLVCGFAASKIRAEMGAPFGYLTPYFGMQFVGAIGGFAVFHSTGMLVASIAAGFLCPTVFLLIAPVQVEMMELGRHFKVRPRDVGAGLALGLLGGFLIGGFVMLCWAYGFGANNLKYEWAFDQNWYFDGLQGFRTWAANADRAMAMGNLYGNPETQPLNFVQNVDAKGLGIGAVITGVLAFLRAKLTWFPFHPIGYVLASTHFMKGCWFTFLVAWGVRMALFRLGGAHIIRRGLVPFCVGMFLACLAGIVIFDGVGVYLRTHGVTSVYSRIP
jgi:hypothetical protein